MRMRSSMHFRFHSSVRRARSYSQWWWCYWFNVTAKICGLDSGIWFWFPWKSHDQIDLMGENSRFLADRTNCCA